MTARAEARTYTDLPLDGWSGPSRHFSAQGTTLDVEATPRGPLSVSLRACRGAEIVAQADLSPGDDAETARLAVTRPDGRHPGDVDALAAVVEAAFQRAPKAKALLLPGLAGTPAVLGLAAETQKNADGEAAVIRRAAFHQLPLMWRMGTMPTPGPLIRSSLGPPDRLPPLRPPQPIAEMYRRWLPQLGLTLSIRPIDRRRDLALFHGWMNQPRVAFYWELAQDEAALDRYLAEQEADPHIYGVVGSLDDEPVGYFEFYWAKEDRLGPYYDAEDYDRGWHGLIGNPKHLGRPKTLSWFKAVTHCLFLDDPRTRRIMGEPRASHHKMLSYCADAAYDKVKEFDFPHKRAALVCCDRERFFSEVPL